VGEESEETLRGAAEMRGGFLVGIQLAGHEEEIETEAVEEDGEIEHPDARARVAIGQQAVSQAPAGKAEHEHAAYGDATEDEGHQQHHSDLRKLAQRHL